MKESGGVHTKIKLILGQNIGQQMYWITSNHDTGSGDSASSPFTSPPIYMLHFFHTQSHILHRPGTEGAIQGSQEQTKWP